MQKLVSLKVTEAQKKNYGQINDTPPEYPWGTALDLDGEQVKALGLEGVGLGQEFNVVALARVKNVSSSESEEQGKRVNVVLQITDMAVAPKSPSSEEFYRDILKEK